VYGIADLALLLTCCTLLHTAAAAVKPAAAGVDAAEAAGVPIVYGTADLALRNRAGVKAGQTVLVLGASGGVGTAAVQVGCRVEQVGC
jgi:NADPH:quinone reductase-like Zn-dependent oxidoreductase